MGDLCFSQGFKTLDIEKRNIDSNNDIYKIGNVFVYDYVIIENNTEYKLNYIAGLPNNKFELIKKSNDTIASKIHLIIPKLKKSDRTNRNQTEIKYLYAPDFSFISGTGVVENENNIWLHPPRSAIFAALETCPFPYVKLPIEIGKEWREKMTVNEHWSNEKWGVWSKKLSLFYNYKITKKTKLNTGFGEIDCYMIESIAESKIGESKLTSYFSEKFGFVRLEYEMVTGLKINYWLENYSENNHLEGFENILKYIDEQKKTIAKRTNLLETQQDRLPSHNTIVN
ncbi:hypothetical protein BZG02_18990 [Labilibaculum filiforme]|uniref:Uncharacterized protein n=2 Tax=Labilibaculum filiforme TaxID=1940526 RepID=A0A2N3HR85_9BACT|nr:hypothetical protein BZG02_18990 [Labilibaculum filiforme]